MKHIERVDRIKVLVGQVHQRAASLFRRENINLVIKKIKNKLEDHGFGDKRLFGPPTSQMIITGEGCTQQVICHWQVDNLSDTLRKSTH